MKIILWCSHENIVFKYSFIGKTMLYVFIHKIKLNQFQIITIFFCFEKYDPNSIVHYWIEMIKLNLVLNIKASPCWSSVLNWNTGHLNLSFRKCIWHCYYMEMQIFFFLKRRNQYWWNFRNFTSEKAPSILLEAMSLMKQQSRYDLGFI